MKYIFAFPLALLLACTHADKAANIEDLKAELAATEQAFSDSSQKKGFYHAMLDFAAADIVLFSSGDTVLNGIDFIKEQVSKYPDGQKPPSVITWRPERVDVAASGDLGYTYGWYQSLRTDSSGHEKTQRGLYNSVWKKTNGQWKLVMD